jgi:hypothetical protein
MGKSRIGYRLTEDAEYLISRYEDETCGFPPCSRCENSCPTDVAEDIDEFWEIDPDYEEDEMTEPYLYKKGDIVERINTGAYHCVVGGEYTVSRDQTDNRMIHIINDVGEEDFWSVINFKLIKKADAPTPPKSEWFGYKYKVTPETSKLLQEAVFKGGGSWMVSGKEVMYTDSHKILYVYRDGRITTGQDDNEFRNHSLPEKQPPQPEVPKPTTAYQFKAGDKVRVVGNRNTHRRKIGDICYLVAQNGFGGTWKSSTIKDGSWEESCHMHEKDIELVVDKEDKKEDNGCTVRNTTTTTVVKGRPAGENNLCPEIIYDEGSPILAVFNDWKLKQINDLTKQEETTMQTPRKVFNFKLIDSDPALPVDQALVHDFGDVVVEDDIETVKQQLLGDNDLKAILAKHNKKRTENVNLTIQQNTGNTVKLLPLTKIKELTWSVK